MSRSARRTCRVSTLLAAIALALLVITPVAGAAERSFTAKRVNGRTAIFNVASVSPEAVRNAKVKAGSYRNRVSAAQVRRAARRGTLKLRLPSRVARGAKKAGQASRGRRWPKLTIVTKPAPKPAAPAAPARPSSPAPKPSAPKPSAPKRSTRNLMRDFARLVRSECFSCSSITACFSMTAGSTITRSCSAARASSPRGSLRKITAFNS